MTWDFPNKYIKKLRCFSCGLEFENQREFKEHIIEKHEEGRDYILCPLNHCKMPVRDLKSHYKCNHPHAKLPQEGQYRALIWKDFSGKKTKTKRPKFKEGYHVSKKMNGKSFYYRSGYEKTVFECLEKWSAVLAFEVEPFIIPYIHKGQERKYTPDVFVKFTDGTTEIWEIKPSNQTSLQKNKDKWSAANVLCEHKGWNFVVMVESKINQLKKIVNH